MERLLSVQDVAEQLSVTSGTIYRLKDRPEGIRACRVGRCIRFRQEDVDDYLVRQAVKPVEPVKSVCKSRFRYEPGMKVV